MGSELSCPCGNRVEYDEVENKKQDIVETLIKSRLSVEDLCYHFYHNQTKACLIKTEQLDRFFNSRQLLNLNSEKNEYRKDYCSLVFITNFAPLKDCIFILLRYTTKVEDKSFRATKTNKVMNI